MNNQAQLSPPLKEQHNLNQPPLRHNLDHSGGTTVARVIEDIIKAASVQIRHNKILARHLNRFSKDETIQNIDAVNSMFFNMGGNK